MGQIDKNVQVLGLLGLSNGLRDKCEPINIVLQKQSAVALKPSIHVVGLGRTEEGFSG